jgi:hypothetical protein
MKRAHTHTHTHTSIAYHPQAFTSMVLDPLDSRRLCLTGSQGALLLLQLTNPSVDEVEVQQYRVSMPAGEREGDVCV